MFKQLFNHKNLLIISIILGSLTFLLAVFVVSKDTVGWSMIFDFLKSEPKILTLIIGVSAGVLSMFTVVPNLSKFLLGKATVRDENDELGRELELLRKRAEIGRLKADLDFKIKHEPTPREILIRSLKTIENNISDHLNKLARNSIVNLTIGIFGTTVSISVLTISLFSSTTFTDINQFLLNFIPKLSFVVCIQLFAFFFLRLYKSNLEDSKYFQNELTNITAKTLSIDLASQIEDKQLIATLISELARTERNFKLANGETLLSIEKTKLDNNFDKEVFSTFKQLVNLKREESKDKSS